ncbi:MAG: hypothetical protein GY819_11470 [Planctomycetaceae bacterium]|nr:hypothetical protein [Planctomycetaceae bacterium]
MSFFGKKPSPARSNGQQRKSRKAAQFMRGLVLEGLGIAVLGYLYLTIQNTPTPTQRTVSTDESNASYASTAANSATLAPPQGPSPTAGRAEATPAQNVIAVESKAAFVRAAFWGCLGTQ